MSRRVLAVLVAAVTLVGTAGAATATPVAASTTANGADPTPSTYLALGDSLAAGYQPGLGENRSGGYVGQVLSGLNTASHPTELVNLACSGETAASMVSGGHCDTYPAGSQLAQALDYLRANPGRTSVITIDIGANDIQRCVVAGSIDTTCVAAGMAEVHTNLRLILNRLRDAAPHAEIVALTYYDPFLAAWLLGPGGQALATQSLAIGDALNVQIERAAERQRVDVADVAKEFRTHTWRTVQSGAFGPVPKNVDLICSWTWMCTAADIHANDAGYAALARTVLATLGIAVF